MGPMWQDSANGAAAPQSEATRTTDVDGKRADRAFSLRSVRSLASPAEARLNERLARVLGQKRGPDTVIVTVLCAAMFFGLIGFAVHFLWIVAIIVMALGLGYTVANSRRNRIDVANQRAEEQPDSAAERR
jgi:Flp pilus assembly protein TadB